MLSQGAHRPDRVAVADEELARPARVRRRGEELAAARLSLQTARTEPDVPQLRGEADEERLLGLRQPGRGFQDGPARRSRATISSRRLRRWSRIFSIL